MLTYLFLIVNVTYGIAFIFFEDTGVIERTVLAQALFPEWVWGIACLSLVAVTIWGIASRKKIIGGSTGLPGVMIWGYGFALALLECNFLVAFSIYLPQVMFWVFWHIGVIRFFEKEEQLSELVDNKVA